MGFYWDLFFELGAMTHLPGSDVTPQSARLPSAKSGSFKPCHNFLFIIRLLGGCGQQLWCSRGRDHVPMRF